MNNGNRHNEKYVLFCKKHDCPCCKKCVVDSHMECKELTDIDDITRNIKSSNACDTILKDLKTREEEESNKIRQLLKSLNDKEKDITEYQTNIANIKQYASDLLTFLALKHIEKDVSVDEAYIQSIVKNLGANQIDFSCKVNPSLQDLISTIQKFGDVVVTADPCNVLILKHKDKQAQMMVAVTPITIDSLNPTLLQTLDTKLECNWMFVFA
ncbi:unnamed protein product [Mytilus edulis]|uniref:B box-type domain-containing protein n=1 Tax=Mytilus edulis TaxID=6550 RepID=A0A8S3V0H2_MYTED|nr:unnamed protein product [Mytilus edulis]